MKFTGERVIPDDPPNKYLYLEHITRYMYAAQFVSGQTVLDFGCGTGYGSAYLAAHGARQVIGTDLDQEAIHYAQNHYQALNLAYVVGNCLASACKSQMYDIIVSFEVIEHVEPGQNYLAEISRLLKKGGYFIGSTPNKQLHSPDIDVSYNPFHLQEYFLDDLKAILSDYFAHVWILGQSPLQGFLIGQTQSLVCQVQDNHILTSGSVLALEQGNLNKTVDQAKDFVFICQKEANQSVSKNADNFELPLKLPEQIYLSDPIAVEYMRVIQIIKKQEQEVARLNHQLEQYHDRLTQFEKGRFIRFMAWLNKLKQKFAFNRPSEDFNVS
jgi:hypothetical protein